MGNAQEIFYGEEREIEPAEYTELQEAIKKFDSDEELRLVCEVRKHLKKEWIQENKELTDFISLACLRYRKYDVDRAVKRMNNYFNWRVENIKEGLQRQSTDDGSLLRKMFDINMVKLLPDLTQRGQSCVYIRMRKARPDLFEASEVVQMVHYIMLIALKRNPISQVMGIISLGDLEGAGSAQLDKNVPRKIIGMISQHLPIRLAGLFICHPNILVSIIVPLAKLFMTKKMKDRLKVVGDDNELLIFGFKQFMLPKSLGGNFNIEDDGNPFPVSTESTEVKEK